MTLAEWLERERSWKSLLTDSVPAEVLAEIESLQAVARFMTEPGDFHSVLTGYEAEIEGLREAREADAEHLGNVVTVSDRHVADARLKLERAEAVIAVAAEVAEKARITVIRGVALHEVSEGLLTKLRRALADWQEQQ